MEGMGLKLTPVVVECLLGRLGMFELDLWLALLGLIASPNGPNRGYGLPLTSPPTLPPPITCH